MSHEYNFKNRTKSCTQVHVIIITRYSSGVHRLYGGIYRETCVCLVTGLILYIHTHTYVYIKYTYIYIYIYIYTYVCVCVCVGVLLRVIP